MSKWNHLSYDFSHERLNSHSSDSQVQTVWKRNLYLLQKLILKICKKMSSEALTWKNLWFLLMPSICKFSLYNRLFSGFSQKRFCQKVKNKEYKSCYKNSCHIVFFIYFANEPSLLFQPSRLSVFVASGVCRTSFYHVPSSRCVVSSRLLLQLGYLGKAGNVY